MFHLGTSWHGAISSFRWPAHMFHPVMNLSHPSHEIYDIDMDTCISWRWHQESRNLASCPYTAVMTPSWQWVWTSEANLGWTHGWTMDGHMDQWGQPVSLSSEVMLDVWPSLLASWGLLSWLWQIPTVFLFCVNSNHVPKSLKSAILCPTNFSDTCSLQSENSSASLRSVKWLNWR